MGEICRLSCIQGIFLRMNTAKHVLPRMARLSLTVGLACKANFGRGLLSVEIMTGKMQSVRERHRLYHGSVEPDIEIDLPVFARRRGPIPDSAPIPVKDPKTGWYITKGPLTREQIEEEGKDCQWCQLKKFTTFDLYPVTIRNYVDTAELPANFEFIEESILCEGVVAADDAFRVGCECKRDQDCERRGCSCLQDMDIQDEDIDPRTKIYAYLSRGPNKDCLRLQVLQSRDPIYECHSMCHCSENCNNRVVERGRRIPLEIFRTSDGRGWGVRSSISIQQGQYVDKYVGEIITASEAQRRREDSGIAQRKDVYLFALDKFSNKESMDHRLAGPPFEVDGEFKAGPTRFINHSCEPNLRSFARVGDHADKHIHDLAFFAIRYIPAGEELTFDYVAGVDTDLVEDLNDPERRKDMEICLCGSDECRGYLW